MIQDQYNDDITASHYPTTAELDISTAGIFHRLMRAVWGCDFTSPIKNYITKSNFKVLDIGCGTGIWTLQLSKEYPLANFYGVDMLPLYPKEFSQNNLQFVQGDILKGLPFADNTFDFIHMRHLIVAFTQEQWDEIVVKELVRVCKPGGWIEIVDFDLDGKSMGPIFKRFLTFFAKFLGDKGLNSLITEELPDIIENTDQVDAVYTEEIYVALGNWGGETGRLSLEAFVSILEGLKNELSKSTGISEKDYVTMLNQFVQEANRTRSYSISIRFYFQKETY